MFPLEASFFPQIVSLNVAQARAINDGMEYNMLTQREHSNLSVICRSDLIC